MTRITPILCAASLLVYAAGLVFAQSAGAQLPPAGGDPAMTQPQGSAEPAGQTLQPVQNPESTVGLAPTDQPVNNAKPRVAGEVLPSSQETAAHNDSIFEHDMQPTLTHTFNFTADQRQDIVAALAKEKGVSLDRGIDLSETTVVPPSVDLKPVPDQIAQEMPWVKPYLYVKAGDRIVLVNPLGRYVAAVIE